MSKRKYIKSAKKKKKGAALVHRKYTKYPLRRGREMYNIAITYILVKNLSIKASSLLNPLFESSFYFYVVKIVYINENVSFLKFSLRDE
jgi:hypothetical protein